MCTGNAERESYYKADVEFIKLTTFYDLLLIQITVLQIFQLFVSYIRHPVFHYWYYLLEIRE